MIDYIEANCVVPPVCSHPCYDEDSDTWDVHFQDKEDGEVICIPLETPEEAQELIQKSVDLAYKDTNNEEPNQ